MPRVDLENLRFTAPLTAVTAAVVGVILNLAVFFAYHVLWPAGLARGPSLNFANEHEKLRHGRVIYEALYAWCAQSCK